MTAGTDMNGVVQTFEAASMRDALSRVKQVFGRDAIILSQKQLDLGVIVTATDDLHVAQNWVDGYSNTNQTTLTGPEDDENAAQAIPTQTPEQPESQAMPSADSVPVTALAGKNSETRGQTPSVARSNSGNAKNAAVLQVPLGGDIYRSQEFEEFAHISEVQNIRTALIRRLPSVHERLEDVAGIYRFLGVNGVGKTAALMGLMADLLNKVHSSDIAVVNSDLERAGASETLQLHCQVFGVDYLEANETELKTCLDTLRAKRVVLIDTVGLDERANSFNLMPLDQYGRCLEVWVAGAHMSPTYLDFQLQKLRAGLTTELCVCVSHTDGCVDADTLLAHLWRWRLNILGLTVGPGRQPQFELFASENMTATLWPETATVKEEEMSVGPVPEVTSGHSFEAHV